MAYSQEIDRLIRCSINHITKTEFFPAFYAAHQATITESNIRGGFRGVGLIPFNPESAISKLDMQLRTPTPPEEDIGQAQPWTPKTPRTVNEADSHSEYLQRRIRGHKSSSPESIINTMKSTVKALKENMQEMALLRAEVRDLREQNTALSRTKRIKRSRLQDSAKMTIGNSQSQIDQVDVDTQVVAESSRSGGRGRSEGSKVWRCRICGKAGHNARTCQEVIEVIEEEDSNQF
jgi:type I site-specific restriction endonuclease